MTINKTSLKMIEADLQSSFAAIEQKHGIKLSFGRGSFTPENAKIALLISSITNDGQVVTEEATAFKQLASLYGLQPEDLGRRFESMGGTYAICGLKPRASKLPILAEKIVDDRPTGKRFKFPVAWVKAALATSNNSESSI